MKRLDVVLDRLQGPSKTWINDIILKDIHEQRMWCVQFVCLQILLDRIIVKELNIHALALGHHNSWKYYVTKAGDCAARTFCHSCSSCSNNHEFPSMLVVMVDAGTQILQHPTSELFETLKALNSRNGASSRNIWESIQRIINCGEQCSSSHWSNSQPSKAKVVKQGLQTEQNQYGHRAHAHM